MEYSLIIAGLALIVVGIVLWRGKRKSTNKSDGGPGEEGGK